MEYLQGKIKHDKKINIWTCFAYSGVGNIYHIKGTLDKIQFHYILQYHMMPSLRALINSPTSYFQRDNDPKHTSKFCQNYLNRKKVNVLKWPSKSPDLNPMENAYKKLNDMCCNRRCRNEKELFEVLKEAWRNMDVEYIQNLINSMPRRCKAVIAARVDLQNINHNLLCIYFIYNVCADVV
jgi:hypothetical protein